MKTVFIALYLIVVKYLYIVNGEEICCIYNKFSGASGIEKYINYLKSLNFDILFKKVSICKKENVKKYFDYNDVSNDIFYNCYNILNNLYNLDLQLPLNCNESTLDLRPLKKSIHINVMGETVKKDTSSFSKKGSSNEQDQKNNFVSGLSREKIVDAINNAKRNNYAGAEKIWKKTLEDFDKKQKNKSVNYIQYFEEYTTFEDLLRAALEEIGSQLHNNKDIKSRITNVYIYNNLLNYDNFEIIDDFNSFIPKTKMDYLRMFQSKLKNEYLNLYSKEKIIEDLKKREEIDKCDKQFNIYNNTVL